VGRGSQVSTKLRPPIPERHSSEFRPCAGQLFPIHNGTLGWDLEDYPCHRRDASQTISPRPHEVSWFRWGLRGERVPISHGYSLCVSSWDTTFKSWFCALCAGPPFPLAGLVVAGLKVFIATNLSLRTTPVLPPAQAGGPASIAAHHPVQAGATPTGATFNRVFLTCCCAPPWGIGGLSRDF